MFPCTESSGPAVRGSELDQKRALQEALREARGSLAEAAAQLGISRATLWRRRKKYGL